MRYIAHRGLFEGPNKELENRPEQIKSALTKGYDVEIDLWWHNNNWMLGHDEPQYIVSEQFIGHQRLWIHCKNLDALYKLSICPIRYVYFWHQKDDFTLTSNNILWTYPGQHLTNNSIAVMPESTPDYWDYCRNLDIIGVCTDYVERFKFAVENSTVPVWTAEELSNRARLHSEKST